MVNQYFLVHLDSLAFFINTTMAFVLKRCVPSCVLPLKKDFCIFEKFSGARAEANMFVNQSLEELKVTNTALVMRVTG